MMRSPSSGIVIMWRAVMANNKAGKERTKVFGRGSHECLLCGRKQGIVRRQYLLLQTVFPRMGTEMGFKKLN